VDAGAARAEVAHAQVWPSAPEHSVSLGNSVNDFPEYGLPPPIGHGGTLSLAHQYVRPGPTSDRGGRSAGTPYQQYQNVVE
jgi:hypothetical protein